MGNIMGNKNKNIIWDKIMDKEVLDSEIIQEIESVKHNDSGFDINGLDEERDGWTLLKYAVRSNREKLVEYLLMDPNINVNHKSPLSEFTAMHLLCIYTDNVHILKLFLGHRDININNEIFLSQTELHCACCNNRIKIVKELLLDARINIMLGSLWGVKARYIAKDEGHVRIVNILKRIEYTFLIRIPNGVLCRDIVRMIIEEYV